MNKVLLLAGLSAMILVGGCNQKKVDPNANALRPVEPPPAAPAGSSSLMGAPAGAANTSAMDTSIGGGMGMVPPGNETLPPEATHTPTASKAPAAKSGATRVTTPTHTSSAKSAVASAKGTKYVVKKGDTLSGIAKKHYGTAGASTIRKIVAANKGMNPNKILVGQTIVLP